MSHTLHEESYVRTGGHPYTPATLGGAVLGAEGAHPYPETPPDLREVYDQETPSLMDLAEDLEVRAHTIDHSESGQRGPEELDPSTKWALASGNYTPEQLQGFIHSAFTWQNAVTNRYHREGIPTPGNFGPILSALRAAPIDKLFVAYHLDQRGNRELQSVIERTEAAGNVRDPIKFYQALYGANDALELASPRAPAQRDPVVQELFTRKATIRELERKVCEELVPADIGELTDDQQMDVEDAARTYEDDFLRDVVRLPTGLRTDLQVASYARTGDTVTGVADPRRLASLLTTTWTNIMHLGQSGRRHEESLNGVADLQRGVEKAVALREHAGIVNFDTRSAEQLDLMSRLIEGDQDTIDHLNDGDVTVIFTDEFSDHNGGAQRANANYDTGNERTLTFGITCRDDFRAHKELLKKLGIKPSTIVLSAHGEFNGIAFGAGDTGFTITNELPPSFVAPENLPKDRMYLDYADDLLGLINEGMQDSKGIDDNPEAKGRRRFIFNVCYQAAPSDAVRYAYRRVAGQSELEVIPFKTGDNMAEDLIRVLGNDPNLDVIAGSAAQGVVRTRYGVLFGLYQSYNDRKKGRPIPSQPTPMKVNRHYYDAAAKIVRSEGMDELRLRAKPDKNIPEHVPRTIPEYPPFYED